MTKIMIKMFGPALLLGSCLLFVACGGGDGSSDTNMEVFDCANLADFDPYNINHINVCARDADKDGIEDNADNCPADFNVNQTDTDLDTVGDICDSDADDDGIENAVDNCPVHANSDQANRDGDEPGDLCDLDNDNDGFDDSVDNCPLVANKEQADLDGDGIGDVCDENPELPPVAAEYCEGDEQIARNEVPPTTNDSLGRVTERQMLARIMAGAAYLLNDGEMNVLVSDAFNAARQANESTAHWNDCESQKKWGNLTATIKFRYPADNVPVIGELAHAPMRVYQNQHKVIIAFQGTEKGGDGVNDINVSIRKYQGVDFHAGVVNHYNHHKYNGNNGVVQILRNSDLNNSSNPKELFFTGHSLGGSTANLALYDYVVRYKGLSKIYPQSYTFGANAFVEKGKNCIWNTTYPYRHCHDNPNRFEYTTAYGYGRTTHVKNLIHNFANTHDELIKNDPIPHAFPRFSHVGYHYTLLKTGDSLADSRNGAVDGDWRIRSSHHFDGKGGFDVKLTAFLRGGYTAHSLCFYVRSLEYSVGEGDFKWMASDRPSAMAQTKGGEQCVYND